MKIFGKQYRLTERGRKAKNILEVAWAGAIGAALAYAIVLHWFG